MIDDNPPLKSLNNGLSLYEYPSGVMIRKDYDRVPFAFVVPDYDVDSNVVWYILWDDGFEGGTIDHVIVYDSLRNAVDVVNEYWAGRKQQPDTHLINELNENLRQSVVAYFGDSVIDIDKYNNMIYDCHIHNYPVEVALQSGTKSRFLMSLLYTVDVDESTRRRTFAHIRPILYSRDGNITARWTVLSSVGSSKLNSTFDSFTEAADYVWKIAGDLVMAIVNNNSHKQQLNDVLARELASLV